MDPESEVVRVPVTRMTQSWGLELETSVVVEQVEVLVVDVRQPLTPVSLPRMGKGPRWWGCPEWFVTSGTRVRQNLPTVLTSFFTSVFTRAAPPGGPPRPHPDFTTISSFQR